MKTKLYTCQLAVSISIYYVMQNQNNVGFQGLQLNLKHPYYIFSELNIECMNMNSHKKGTIA